MEVLQTLTWDTVTGYHLESESLNLLSFVVKRILGEGNETNICLPTKTSQQMKCCCHLQLETWSFFSHQPVKHLFGFLTSDPESLDIHKPFSVRPNHLSHTQCGLQAPFTLITSHHYTTSCQIKTFKLCECLLGTFPFSQQHIAEIIEDISSQTVTKRWKARRERWQLLSLVAVTRDCQKSLRVYLGSSRGI